MIFNLIFFFALLIGAILDNFTTNEAILMAYLISFASNLLIKNIKYEN